jgi:TRAP transporter 4TM/12TM fusion protein
MKEIKDELPERAGLLEKRSLTGWQFNFVWVMAVTCSLYHLSLAYFGMPESLRMRATHLFFLVPLTFLLYPASRNSPHSRFTAGDFVWFAISSLSFLYVAYFEYDRLVTRIIYVDPLTQGDMVVGAALLVCTLEATRRAVGFPLLLVALVALAYAGLGERLPGTLGHTGYSLGWILEHLTLTTEGIFGIPAGASATFVFLFVLFGTFLQSSGAGQFFIDLAYAAAGRSRGGPAKMAVLASGLMGTVSGTAVGNVVTTGSYTIPLMKRVGYRPVFAGAVESAASTGGQIMPPIMGAAAFILAEFLGMPYLKVAAAAAIPAVLYFLSVGFAVDFEALKHGLRGIPGSDLPPLKGILKKDAHLSLPLFVIIAFLVGGFTPYMAGFGSILAVVAVSYARAHTRLSPRAFSRALSLGAQGAIVIAVTCAVAGVVIGSASLTGIAVKFAAFIVSMAGGKLYLALPLIMIASLILGMGLPTTAAYVMVAALAVPALVEMGVLPLAAHLFAFYFACISAITPPVAIAAYAGAGLAGSPAMKTGWEAVKLAAAGFLVPYMFVYGPQLLLQGEWWRIIVASGTALVGCYALSAAVVGWFRAEPRLWERAVLFVAALVLISPIGLMSFVGIGLLGLIYLAQAGRARVVLAGSEPVPSEGRKT